MKNMRNTRGKFVVLAACLVIAALLFTGCGGDKVDVLAEVNGEEITRQQLDDVLKMVRLVTPDVDAMLEDESFREYFEETFLRMLVDNALIRDALESEGLQVDEAEMEEVHTAFYSQLTADLYGSEEELDKRLQDLKLTEDVIKELLRGEVAANVLFAHLLADLTDEDVRIFAEEYGLLQVDDSVMAHHILLETEEEALEALERIRGGEDFNAVAEELSTDMTAEVNRGLLGEIFKNDPRWDADFKAGAFALQAGEISEPVHTQFGWHVIWVEEKSDGYLKDFETEKERLRLDKEEMIINSYFDELWETADIQYFS